MRWLPLLLVLLVTPVRAQDADPEPVTVALWVSGYGPILPSEWREHLLPAARRSLGRLHDHWRMLSAAEVARIEADADRRAESDSTVTFAAVLAEHHPGAKAFALDARCGDDECYVRGVSELEDGAHWTFPRTLSVRRWTRALGEVPENVRIGVGRGVGGSGLMVSNAFGSWTDESRAQATEKVRALPWPEACAPERSVILDLVVEVKADGSVGEVGASGSTRHMRRCLERALGESLPAGSFARQPGNRRLLLLAISRP
ncbi:MAG: hypothetical protein JJ863_16775 [Deltaproteobacteria bacterium]|nr:hypothetical protein [Deltaproteobacteria bacterium]